MPLLAYSCKYLLTLEYLWHFAFHHKWSCLYGNMWNRMSLLVHQLRQICPDMDYLNHALQVM